MATSNSNQALDLKLAVEFMTAHLPLTPRQAEVMHWIAEGKTNEEIATILVCARNTVKAHVREIFQRLGVHNRSAAVSLLYRAHIRLMRAFGITRRGDSRNQRTALKKWRNTPQKPRHCHEAPP